MSDFAGVFYRYITILQSIPSHPRYITTPELLQLLEQRGMYLTQRSIQRDLSERLSIHFPILCDESTRPYRWSLDNQYHVDLPVPNNWAAGYSNPNVSSLAAT
ncbi:hypothetical protein ELY33_00995 [Vreelandella andesensis]|uniref:WYL domain-containing protein n=1 Tax=Vreelandella andesensis TaxID=447567 RepID=A0A433KYR7_9GAMM|nr:hypothetical protein [Halomonas andesensis]RUR34787.1 hypothetical protein ELY33_00995 [Halomonas andesensis]